MKSSSSVMNYSPEAARTGLPDRVREVPLWKRALDLTIIVLAMPLLLPLGFLIALYIKVVSPGPVLFKQERVGYRGRRFMCLKFRSMVVNADTGVHQGHLDDLIKSGNKPLTKLDAEDRRLIPGGLVLRSLGVDEMPQLINVLWGDMSLVGPRPCIPYEYAGYPPQYRRRCDTLPGLTGLWQVNGKNRTTFEQMMEFDLEYVKRKSLLLDLKILAMTIPAILRQAYDVKVRKRKQGKRQELRIEK